MNIERIDKGIRYTLSNENLKEGDEVFPIAWGRCLDDGGWILTNFNFKESMSGFPNEPHIILDLHHTNYKPYEIRTDYGYGPAECYYKIIKKEILLKEGDFMFTGYKWIEIK